MKGGGDLVSLSSADKCRFDHSPSIPFTVIMILVIIIIIITDIFEDCVSSVV